MNMRTLVQWFTWIRLYWKYQFGMRSRVSGDIRAFATGGDINGNTKAWCTPSEGRICKDFEQLEGDDITHFKWITLGIWLTLIAVFWLLFRTMGIMPRLLEFLQPSSVEYLDIFMGIIGGIGVIILIWILSSANEKLPLQVTKQEAEEAAGNLRLSGEIGRQPTPTWQRLSLLVVVALEAAIFGSLVISYVGDFTNTQNLLAGGVFGIVLAIVLTVMTHKAGKAIYVAFHHAKLVKAVTQETEQVIETRKSQNSGSETGVMKQAIEHAETFGNIKRVYGITQFDGEPLPFIKAWGIPILTLVLAIIVAVAGFVVRDSIQNNIIDIIKRQQIEETSLRSELDDISEQIMIPEDIMEETRKGQEQQIDSVASNERKAARFGILIIAITFLGLQVITTLIGYSDGFSFSENAHTYYPRWMAYEKHTRVFTNDVLEKHRRARIEAFYRRVDSLLAKYYNIAFSNTGRSGRSMPLHKALESRGPLQFEAYKKYRTPHTKA
uniref:Uncharacterized protein n=1 Tax=Candidatus Kentrum sp. MB TaxID=2138164 RepID=A0A450XCV8_9GAMM|nr:MAG: hypothetical protein BECKMB1821G_GA0114241_10097 [Candidatus Kentron sp. MB]VFK27117.1 MAG: hypothetical protein BECKMB1821I_GA0114274_100245 [Candidatus Kentron sp. MB]VFK74900.1 MAG: hypothetical protein BECKMB1821H_GA0114242_10128 [Candidatus Kentron sp. MB]